MTTTLRVKFISPKNTGEEDEEFFEEAETGISFPEQTDLESEETAENWSLHLSEED